VGALCVNVHESAAPLHRAASAELEAFLFHALPVHAAALAIIGSLHRMAVRVHGTPVRVAALAVIGSLHRMALPVRVHGTPVRVTTLVRILMETATEGVVKAVCAISKVS